MITKAKLKAYQKYKGDSDMFVRVRFLRFGRMDEQDFLEIRNLLQDARLVNRGLASDDYANNVKKKISDRFDSQQTIDYLNFLANNTDY